MTHPNRNICIDCGAGIHHAATRCRSCHLAQVGEKGEGPNPSGLCQCGCGRPTPIARQTRGDRGDIRGEHVRYIRGHANRGREVATRGPERNSQGLCECGCGQPAPIARDTHASLGVFKGQRMRFIRGHQRGYKRPDVDDPNPSGMCLCGCGETTPLARETRSDRLAFKGKHLRFVPWHGNRKLWLQRKWNPSEESECHIWDGCTINGYGVLTVRGVAKLAHRHAYQEAYGPIPPDHHIHHRCRNPLCVNPEHLVALTIEEHMRMHGREAARMRAHGRSISSPPYS